jgi:hypothetical protein
MILMVLPKSQTEPTLLETSLYESDFYAWTMEQASLLRSQQWTQVDLPNLIEEIESLGKQQRQELRNRLGVLIGHLLKWEYQPQRRSRSWLATIRLQRLDIVDLLEDNPSLKSYLEEALQKAYLKGVALAAGEANLPEYTFPQSCSYSLPEILNDRFFPGELSELTDQQN